ncbi:MAG: hypothetical protein EOO89_08975 [Pedobacter sp.]|nr:MAG: hypothetical protein EOO89_08975 [Pedobacter sp.]
MLNKVLSIKSSFENDPFDNASLTQLKYYAGTLQTSKYLAAAKIFVNEKLLKLPADSLIKWDAITFEKNRKQRERITDPRINSPAVLATFRRTSTLKHLNNLNEIARNFYEQASNSKDLQSAIAWSDNIIQMASADEEFYRNYLPGFVDTNVRLYYKAGDKETAINKLQNLIRYSKNISTMEYITLLNKMKANEAI